MRAEEMTVGIELCDLENLRIFNGYDVGKKERQVIFSILCSFSFPFRVSSLFFYCKTVDMTPSVYAVLYTII